MGAPPPKPHYGPKPPPPGFQPPPGQVPPPGHQPKPGQGQPPPGYQPKPGQGPPPPGYQPQGQPPPGYQPKPGQGQPPPGYQPKPGQGPPPKPGYQPQGQYQPTPPPQPPVEEKKEVSPTAEADAKVKKMTVIAVVWFLVAMLVWMVMGYMFWAQAVEFDAQHDSASRDLFKTFAYTWIVFGIMAMMFLAATAAAILGAIKNDAYAAAYNRSILIGAVGIFFGLGAGIALVLNAKKNIKVHPKYLATLPVPTPICERCGQPVQFDKDAGGWYCPTCKIHLTKGTKKTQKEKPILPPVAPKPRPMGPYPPKPMGPGGPPGGPPPKPMGPPGGQVRNLTCGNCGKTFQWNIADPSIRMAKCPWCNNQVPL